MITDITHANEIIEQLQSEVDNLKSGLAEMTEQRDEFNRCNSLNQHGKDKQQQENIA